MSSKSKGLTLVLILVLAVSREGIMMIKAVNAQNPSPTPLPVPSTPTFTVAITNTSYYNTTDNSYVDALSVTITIRNQPLALSVKSDKYNGFKYFIEVKPHDASNWESLSGFLDGFNSPQVGFGFLPSNSSSTLLTFQFSNPYFLSNGEKEYSSNSSALTYVTNYYQYYALNITLVNGENVDFKATAGIGTLGFQSMGVLYFIGNYSSSNQLAITIANGETAAANVSSSPTPTVPEFSVSAIILLFLSILSIAVVFRRIRKTGDSEPLITDNFSQDGQYYLVDSKDNS